MPVYRAPMRSRRDDVDPGLAVERALALGVVGMGEPEDPRAEARLERFVDVPLGAEVWTRDPDGLFRHGTITGPWRRDDDPAARAADLVHVRDCAWDPEPFEEHRVPPAVAATYRRGGRNFQRVRAL